MYCLFCNSKNVGKCGIPPTFFNEKEFQYIKCNDCELLFLNPIPDSSDLENMYQTSYQGNIEKEKIDIKSKMPGLRFPYTYQLDLIKKYSTNASLLDFGCGTGHFVYNAELVGIASEGVEFSDETVEKLNTIFYKSKFYTVNDFYKTDKKYDFIRLSNVLEHFTNPKSEFKQLIDKLGSNGVILIEGPLELNSSIVNWTKWNYLKLRMKINKNYRTFHQPTHICFSNYINQFNFFENLGLETILYEVKENTWPYPERINEIKSPLLFIKFVLGFISRLNKIFSNRYGNTFIYVGKKK